MAQTVFRVQGTRLTAANSALIDTSGACAAPVRRLCVAWVRTPSNPCGKTGRSRLEVSGADACGAVESASASSCPADFRIRVQLVAPPSNPALPLAGVRSTASVLDTDLRYHRAGAAARAGRRAAAQRIQRRSGGEVAATGRAPSQPRQRRTPFYNRRHEREICPRRG